jgi:sarcosine oxidase gamma subunit
MDTLYQVANQTTFQKKIMSAEPNNIVCQAGGEEMLRVGPDGFWVRGQKVPQDDQEAQAVYNAFKQWMAWASLEGRY